MSQAREALSRAIARAREAGAAAADGLVVEETALETRVRGEEIDFVKQSRERCLGLRVFMAGDAGLRSAVTSTSDLAPAAIDSLADQSVALASATAPDPSAGLPGGGYAETVPDLALVDPADRDVAVEARIADARSAERAARAVDPRIANSEGSEAGSSFRDIAYANSDGFEGAYSAASHGLAAMPIARENGAMQVEYWHTAARTLAGLDAPEVVGRTAAERAVRQLGARQVATCEVPVIFEPRVARSLLGHLAACLSGGAVYRETSFLRDRMGEGIASERVTVIDDGTLSGGLGSRPFDGEGQPTRRNALVTAGRLDSWLLDSYAGRKLGLPSTGNASRGAGGSPSPGATNLWLEPGDTTQADIIASTERGLLVTWLFGHGFNPVTGDFSRGAAGLWIEGGELRYPVNEITIAGNLGDMLHGIDAVGDDLLWIGSVASPTLRIGRMTVAGA